MTKLTTLLLLISTAFFCVACSSNDKTNTISQQELVSRINDSSKPTIIDVRTPQEFASGHIPGAINLPIAKIERGVQQLKLAFADEIVVYCERGAAAQQAQQILKSNGYFEVRHLIGDMAKWRESKLPCAGCGP